MELQATRIVAGIDNNTSVASLAYKIQQYAKQVAEQALKDAADNHTDTHTTLSGWEDAVKKIRSTPIVTP